MIYYKPDFSKDLNSPFARDENNKLIRRNYWLDLPDQSVIMIFTQGVGKDLTNQEKKNHLIDIKRQNLIDDICVTEVLPPEN